MPGLDFITVRLYYSKVFFCVCLGEQVYVLVNRHIAPPLNTALLYWNEPVLSWYEEELSKGKERERAREKEQRLVPLHDFHRSTSCEAHSHYSVMFKSVSVCTNVAGIMGSTKGPV